MIHGAHIQWTNVRDYLVARGWRKLPVEWDDAGVFRLDDAEVLVPFDPSLADYDEALVRAAREIARVERREVRDVLDELALPRADHTRFARTGEGAAGGTLPITEAPGFVDGVRRALLAAAHSVERPDQRSHKRMSRRGPLDFVNACRMGPAERRSFALSVHCPLDLSSDLPGTGFGRRAVEILMRSTARATRLLVRDGVQAVVEADEVVITANLCDALVAMMPSDEKSDLELAVDYSPFVVSESPSPTSVKVERSLFESFDRLAQGLRPPEKHADSTYLGRVVELKGEPNDDGDLEGEAVLRLDVEEDLIRVRCVLNAANYQRAIDAHKTQRHVALRGTLRRTGRTLTLENPAELRIIELNGDSESST